MKMEVGIKGVEGEEEEDDGWRRKMAVKDKGVSWY